MSELADRPGVRIPPAFLKRQALALGLLLEAQSTAALADVDPWQMAMEIDRLRDSGITCNALRCLVACGYLDGACEITRPHMKRRGFRRHNNLRFTDSTCFVLTPRGAREIRQVLNLSSNVGLPRRGHKAKIPTFVACADGSRELRFAGRVVKRFRMEASCQELILRSFEELNWPGRIDDPLPRRPQREPKQRLHDAVVRLNRNQIHPLLRFGGDGSGRGIYWDIQDPTLARHRPASI